MQAVILAGGMGTRMLPLKTPKPLMKIAGKSILEHTISQLEGMDVIVVASPATKDSMNFPNIKIVEQPTPKGTWDALLQAQPLLKDKFLVLPGDDIFVKEDIQSCLNHDLSILAGEVKNPSQFGILELQEGFLKGITEKPLNPTSNLANTGLFHLDKEIFSMDVKPSPRGELELTDAVTALAAKRDVAVQQASGWIPIGYPWNLLDANQLLLERMEPKIEGEVEEGAVLKGPVAVGNGTIVKAGSRIEGPALIGSNCTIGPNCYIRPHTSIGNSCIIGNAVEIKNSVLGDNIKAKHLAYIGDSILEGDINIGAGTIAADFRHDAKNIPLIFNNKTIDTGRRKFGCVMSKGVHTGINTSIYPGRVLEKDTLPGEVVK